MPRNLEVRKGVRELALRLGTAHSRCVLRPIFTESGHTTTVAMEGRLDLGKQRTYSPGATLLHRYDQVWLAAALVWLVWSFDG